MAHDGDASSSNQKKIFELGGITRLFDLTGINH